MELRGRHIAVIGLARTGVATANFLVRRGARVSASDGKTEAQLAANLEELDPRVQKVCGDSTPAPNADLVVLSPGVDIHSAALAGPRRRGVEIISEIELASRFSTTPIIAVTGTNGKSTTTMLIGHLLQGAGLDVQVAGNIGTPFIALVEQPPRDYVVLEVSSFQLEGIAQFRPRIALILNITQDHLDRHKSMEEYAAWKMRIAENQTPDDCLILNRDDPRVMRVAEGSTPRKQFFSLSGSVLEGAYLADGTTLMLKRDKEETPLCTLESLQPGMRLQPENVLAAILAAVEAGADPKTLAPSLRTFSGLEHRLEWVRTLDGVDYFNDSKGTNVGAVEKSLRSFDRPVILIMGGRDKGGDFAPLKHLLKQKVKHLILIGEAREKIRMILNGSFGYEDARNLEDAVARARRNAEPGDVVLLSPACASFDMFRDYADRGTQFKKLVNHL